MKNLYEYFEVSINANKKDILRSYEEKISKYCLLSSLTDKQIYEIKMLKVGLHILTDDFLRYKYNTLIQLENDSNSIKINKQKKSQENESKKLVINIDESNNQQEQNINSSIWNRDIIIPSKSSSYDVELSLRPITTSNRRHDPDYCSAFSR